MSAPHLGIDDEDFYLDMVPAIEKSFGIRFEQSELETVRTYSELCGMVNSKLPQSNASDCTSQQAFYKLRAALQAHTAATIIKSTSSVSSLLPAQWVKRRQAAKAIEAALGMKLNILGMPSRLENVCICLVLSSIFGLPVAVIVRMLSSSSMGYWVCLTGFLAGIIGMNAGSRLGSTIKYATIAELVATMRFRFYRQSRRNPGQVNSQEIPGQLHKLFCNDFGIESAQLTPEAILS